MSRNLRGGSALPRFRSLPTERTRAEDHGVPGLGALRLMDSLRGCLCRWSSERPCPATSTRGTGTGTALREAAEEWARSMGIVRLVAPIHHRNAPALSFYGAAGFRDNGRLQVKAL